MDEHCDHDTTEHPIRVNSDGNEVYECLACGEELVADERGFWWDSQK